MVQLHIVSSCVNVQPSPSQSPMLRMAVSSPSLFLSSLHVAEASTPSVAVDERRRFLLLQYMKKLMFLAGLVVDGGGGLPVQTLPLENPWSCVVQNSLLR